MGAAESISDLRSLLSIVAEETGALKMNDADEDSVGWTTEGPLPMTFGHVRRAHAALAALEAALSAAEPVAWLAARKWEQMTAAEPWLTNVVYSEDQAEFFPCVPLYAAPPAPSVAVKALEWAIDENHSQLQRADFYTIESEFRQGFALHTAGKMGVFWFPTEREAKAAAQADYEARIRSALSAQVQDVAGTETTTRFHIEWIAGARPPVHPNPMTGRTTFESFERAVQHMRSQADDAQFVSLEERRTTIVHIDRSADMRAALPAAPAKQEGGE